MSTHTQPRKERRDRRSQPVMMSACQSGGCGSAPVRRMAPPSFSRVLVNKVEIAPEAIAREIQHHPAPDPRTAWTQAARALVVRELLLQEAERIGVHADRPPDEAGRTETRADATISTLLEQEIAPGMPDEGECRRYYEAQVKRFRTPDIFEASHILIEPAGQDAAAWAQAEEEARSIIAQIGDDPRAFAEAARGLSTCPTAHQGGSLGQVRRGELLPEVQNAIEALKPGKTRSEPLRSPHGWHVLRLARRIPGQVLPFEVVKDKIADMLEARSWSMAAARYVAGLAERAEVEGVSVAPEAA